MMIDLAMMVVCCFGWYYAGRSRQHRVEVEWQANLQALHVAEMQALQTEMEAVAYWRNTYAARLGIKYAD